jgi:hypothetical protein
MASFCQGVLAAFWIIRVFFCGIINGKGPNGVGRELNSEGIPNPTSIYAEYFSLVD